MLRDRRVVSPDGKRLMMMKSEQATPATQVSVVLNWSEDLKRRVPVARQSAPPEPRAMP